MSRRPVLRTELPGPAAKAVIAESSKYVSSSYTRDYPLVAAKGRGCWITDPDGNEFLDMTSGIAVCATGHCHPDVVAAIQRQAADLIHMSGTDFYYPIQAEFAARLAGLNSVRGDDHRVYFGNSGAEAVEAAIKLARYRTGRHGLIAFTGSFHGRTMGALSLTASKVRQRERFGPLLPGVFHTQYPDPLRHGSDATARAIEHLELLLSKLISPDEIAAIVVEPIQGEGGYVVPPDSFLEQLRSIADRHGMMLVFDEVQAGMGRTGRMFAWHHSGVAPDIICLAKGIASGMPLGAIVADASVMQWPPGSHASTFGGNPVALAAANATLDLLADGLVDNAARVGRHLRQQLVDAVGDHPRVADIRGRGLMLAVELVTDRTSLQRDGELRNRVVDACFQRGLLILGCGPNCVRFSPALCIDEAEATVAVEIFAETLAATV